MNRASPIKLDGAIMTSTCRTRPVLFPRPQEIAWLGRPLRFSVGVRLEAGDSAVAHPMVRCLLRDDIAGRLGLTVGGKTAGRSPAAGGGEGVRIRLDVLPLSEEDGRERGLDAKDFEALKHPSGQGYVLKAEPGRGRVILVGAGMAGLLYALMTLRQLWRRGAGGRWELPGVRIRDYPDAEYRALDWLMNAECNRWCYDWGDGPRAVAARIKRRLDVCLAYKINLVHFDGLGWDAMRTPGYAALMRDLNTYARDRGILLMAGGCGGGYGPTYQVQFQKQGKYWGRAFYNQRRYPAGAVYLCQGNPLYERRPGFSPGLSRSMGTCLSNAALRALKLKELAAYVRATEPGALYIHDLDTGDYRSTTAAWKLRCPRCRRRWPNDRLEAADGAAGAYADWFKQVRRVLAAIRTPSGYGGRDCRLVFTGPLYTELADSDARWRKQVAYFTTVSARLPPGGNVLFGIREQVGRSGGLTRAGRLNRALAARGHGCMVLCVAGGDGYTNDHVFTPLAAWARTFEGAAGVSLFNGHVHQEAVQMLNAHFLWNLRAPGSRALPGDRRRALAALQRIKQGRFRLPAVYAPGGLLESICARLFGPAAGKPMAELYRLQSPDGYAPTTGIWYPITRRLWNGSNLFDAALKKEWRQRLAVTERARACVARALPLLEGGVREDVAWLGRCLDVAARLLGVLTRYNRGRGRLTPSARRACRRELAGLDRYLKQHVRFVLTDPLGGDVGAWRPAVELLARQCK